MNYSDPTHLTFIIYIFAMLAIGFTAWRYTKNLSDYILGGRRLGSFVTALSTGASDMSGWLLMGLPGAVFVAGFSESWIAFGLVLGAYLNWKLVAARLRVYTEISNNALTLPDYFTHRFEDHSNSLRIISALIILIFFTIYCASGMVAGARLFEQTFSMDYSKALWLGAAATIVYVFIGGFLAVSWTDTVQGSMMFCALIITPIFVVSSLGGFDAAFTEIKNIDASHLSLLQDQTIIGVISLMAWGLGYFGQPHILARFMAAQSAQTIPAARRVGMAWMIACLIGAIAIGLFGIAYFSVHPDSSVSSNPETVFIALAQALFNPWIAGILLSAILAAVMSTLSCQLLVCSSALTEDFYKAFVRPKASQLELVWFGRAMVLLVAIIAILIASNPESRVLNLVSYAWAGFGAAFGPVILLSLFWSGMTRNAALAGMIIGAVTVLVWRHYAWFDLYEMVPGFLFATFTIILISKKETVSETIQSNYNVMKRQLP